MECLCGYKYERDFSDKKFEIGDEPFIEMELSNSISIKKLGTGNPYDGPDETTLYACPKCYTVKIGN